MRSVLHFQHFHRHKDAIHAGDPTVISPCDWRTVLLRIAVRSSPKRAPSLSTNTLSRTDSAAEPCTSEGRERRRAATVGSG